jgi:uncharacterized SAM-binding protein YcdF (DUF218 family)
MRRRTLVLLLLLVPVAAFFSRSAWLPSIALFLIRAEEPVQAEGAAVLAGDAYGQRVLRAAEVAKAGMVPVVYVSGTMPFYEHNEADLSIAMAIKHGYSPTLFEPVKTVADSTREEAANLLEYFRGKGIRKLLVVTSDFHTRRAGRIFRSAARGEEIHMIAAKTENFDPQTWWTTRPARKIVFMEWMKTVADWLRI